MRFKIFYDDGAVFEGNPQHAPKFGVQVIVQEDNSRATVGRELLRYFDYYLYYPRDGKWVGVYGHDGLIDHVVHNIGQVSAVVVGRMIAHERFEEIYLRAKADPDFLPRLGNGRQHGETP